MVRTKAPRHHRLSWAELMRRTWGLDVLACPCGGRLRLLGFVMAPMALASIERSMTQRAASSSIQLSRGRMIAQDRNGKPATRLMQAAEIV